MSKISLIVLSYFLSNFSFGQESIVQQQEYKLKDGSIYIYKKPTLLDVVRYVPNDLLDLGTSAIKKENLGLIGATVGSTILLLPFDQKLLDNAQELGDPIGLAGNVRYTRILEIEFIPEDINGAIYFLGNGLTPVLVAGGFYAVGLINDDYRALNTASELIEVILSAGVVTQTIKRVTGRESPSAAIINENPGGHWTPFPSFKAYSTDTPRYDAMPSGHITTYMAALTVLTTNYPDNKYLKPVGYSLAAILGFEMMSSRVHWASDYPIAILMGYAIGKNAANRRIIKKIEVDETGATLERRYKTDFSFNRSVDFTTVGIIVTF